MSFHMKDHCPKEVEKGYGGNKNINSKIWDLTILIQYNVSHFCDWYNNGVEVRKNEELTCSEFT